MIFFFRSYKNSTRKIKHIWVYQKVTVPLYFTFQTFRTRFLHSHKLSFWVEEKTNKSLPLTWQIIIILCPVMKRHIDTSSYRFIFRTNECHPGLQVFLFRSWFSYLHIEIRYFFHCKLQKFFVTTSLYGRFQ